MQAFVDESYSENRYAFGAAILRTVDLDNARERMRALLLPGQRKVHWRDENTKRRDQILTVIASIPSDRLVVVRTSLRQERPERRRRLCMEQLVVELAEREVELAVFESRLRRDDQRDRDVLKALRVRLVVTPNLKIEHRLGPAEPLLWIPDALCGVVRAPAVVESAPPIHLIEVGRD